MLPDYPFKNKATSRRGGATCASSVVRSLIKLLESIQLLNEQTKFRFRKYLK